MIRKYLFREGNSSRWCRSANKHYILVKRVSSVQLNRSLQRVVILIFENGKGVCLHVHLLMMCRIIYPWILLNKWPAASEAKIPLVNFIVCVMKRNSYVDFKPYLVDEYINNYFFNIFDNFYVVRI